jgi:hypothetical protein
MSLLRCVVVAVLLAAGSLFVSCGGDDEGGGICIADYGIVVECFDCWKESDCTGSNRTWNSDITSCAAAGYTNPTSNECGYTQ